MSNPTSHPGIFLRSSTSHKMEAFLIEPMPPSDEDKYDYEADYQEYERQKEEELQEYYSTHQRTITDEELQEYYGIK